MRNADCVLKVFLYCTTNIFKEENLTGFMAKRENIIPYAPIGKLIQDATGKRVSKGARETGAQILEELTGKIVHKAVLLADNSNRKTVKSKDIRLAFQQLRGGL